MEIIFRVPLVYRGQRAVLHPPPSTLSTDPCLQQDCGCLTARARLPHSTVQIIKRRYSLLTFFPALWSPPVSSTSSRFYTTTVSHNPPTLRMYRVIFVMNHNFHKLTHYLSCILCRKLLVGTLLFPCFHGAVTASWRSNSHLYAPTPTHRPDLKLGCSNS